MFVCPSITNICLFYSGGERASEPLTDIPQGVTIIFTIHTLDPYWWAVEGAQINKFVDLKYRGWSCEH